MYLKRLIGYLCIACLLPLHAKDLSSKNQLTVSEIAPGIFVHIGKHVLFEDDQRDDIANIGFIVGEQCVAVIDTGGSPAIGRQLRNAIKAKTSTPICYVINTHVHADHLLGNSAFLVDNPMLIGHQNLPTAIETNRSYFLERYQHELAGSDADLAIIPPNKLVENVLELDLGKRVIRIEAQPKSHTDNDLIIFDQNSQTLWLADLLNIERIPSFEGSLLGWIAVLEKLMQIRIAMVIPGHGQVSRNWPKAAEPELQYLTTLRDSIRKLIRTGGTLEQALETVGQNEQPNWQLFDQHHKRNVSKAFAELEWE